MHLLCTLWFSNIDRNSHDRRTEISSLLIGDNKVWLRKKNVFKGRGFTWDARCTNVVGVTLLKNLFRQRFWMNEKCNYKTKSNQHIVMLPHNVPTNSQVKCVAKFRCCSLKTNTKSSYVYTLVSILSLFTAVLHIIWMYVCLTAMEKL